MKRKNMTKDQLKTRIINRLYNLILSMESIIRDKQHWNKTRTDAEPFDMGWELAVKDAAKQELMAWNRDDMQAVNVMAKKIVAAGADAGSDGMRADVDSDRHSPHVRTICALCCAQAQSHQSRAGVLGDVTAGGDRHRVIAGGVR